MKSIKKLIFAAAALLSLAAFSSCTKSNDTTKSNDSETYADVLKGEWDITRWYGVSDGVNFDYGEDLMAGDEFEYSSGTLIKTINKETYTYSVTIPDLVKKAEYSDEVAVAGILTEKSGYELYVGITFTGKNNIVITTFPESKSFIHNFECSRIWDDPDED